MKQVFKAHRLCQQDGPLGPYLDSYAAEMCSEGYARQTREVQIRLVADFGCWLTKRRNPVAGDKRRAVPAVPSRASTASKSNEKRTIRFATTAGVVEAAGGGCTTCIAGGDPGGAIAE